ncbi:MAG: hypothetical protein RBR74_04310 [Ignavibacteriaceae bacterium]|jgi:hypothetical protein|nr:MAG: hypothetical protein F9K42_00590 [Ignavibacterium sp.]MDY0082382.1 hypothetical protein [Ignavibacteriaceae bacterium]MEB2297711.1 hypothetical protein [Ignavibacteria bacterium]GIK20620.1 MAG: hypothetical protein BroJett005_00340 [Ignavibacteriota bacterium]MDD5607140.1 hypothetical protein [Ignavibacterium sp.]
MIIDEAIEIIYPGGYKALSIREIEIQVVEKAVGETIDSKNIYISLYINKIIVSSNIKFHFSS